MLDQYLNQMFRGNTVLEWLIALAIILATAILGWLTYRIIGSWIKFLARKTKTKLDDLLVEVLERPIIAFIVLFGIRYSYGTLSFSDNADDWFYTIHEFVTIMTIVWLVLRAYDALHENYIQKLAEKTETDLDDQLLPVMRTLVRFVIFILGFIVALNNAGYNVNSILAGLGIGGLAFALAAQHTVGNLIGGLNIFLDRHFTLGDRIQVEGETGLIDGNVVGIGLRTTRIKTRYEGRIVNIPNSIIANNDVINVDSEEGRQMFQVYKLAPDTRSEKIEQALSKLKELVEHHPDTKETVVTGLIQVNEISCDVMLLYWIQGQASNVKTRTAINLRVLKLFEELGIQFAEKSEFRHNKQTYY